LGYSNSGLREGKVLFFKEGADFTVQKLYETLGDFSMVMKDGIAKYASRVS
jgi:hypothetical protein